MYRKNLLGDADLNILTYTSSMEEDKEIVNEVIESLIAHVKVLTTQGLIPAKKGHKILEELKKLLQNPSQLFFISLRKEQE